MGAPVKIRAASPFSTTPLKGSRRASGETQPRRAGFRKVLAGQGKTVDGGIVMGREFQGRYEVASQNPAPGLGEGNALAADRQGELSMDGGLGLGQEHHSNRHPSGGSIVSHPAGETNKPNFRAGTPGPVAIDRAPYSVNISLRQKSKTHGGRQWTPWH
jgi:hypothetical protein